MADYDFEAWAQSKVASSKPNPNKQAASSMQSVGIGGLGGRTTTAAAQRVQDQFSMFRDDDDRGSTYDYVPQTVTSGLGTPLTFPKKEKEDNRNIDQKIYDGMVSFGARFFGSQKESPSDYVLDVYENSPMFRIPTVPEVTVRGIEKSFEQKLQEMFDSQGQNVYTPEIEGTGSYDEVPAPNTNKNLMRNRINNILKDVIAPNSKEYEIQKGDTLSDISLREGVRVEDLAQVNEIENPNMILEGGTLIIPEAQEMEKAKEYVLRVTTRGDESLVDLTDPDAQFYQSGIPLDQRIYAPEDMTGFAGMGPDPSTGQGIMSPTVGQNIAPEEGLLAARTSNIVYSDPEMDYIVSLEQFREKAYELNSSNLSPTSHKSGLTVANGFDVGQHDRQVLEDMGLSDETINKFGDWIGLNPDTIIDPNTGRSVGSSVAPADRFETVIRDGEPVRVPTREWTDARTRGHTLMAQTFETAETEGTLPSFTRSELEQISKGSYKTFGTDVAEEAYGAGFDDLSEDVKAVLIQEAYVTGEVSDPVLDSARRGNDALTVLNAMPTPVPHLQNRKQNVRQWLNNNSFDDDPKLSKQGIQILANEIIREKDLDIVPLEVDSIIGPNTRRTVNEILREAGKTPPALGSRGDTRRKELLEEVLLESLMPPTEED